MWALRARQSEIGKLHVHAIVGFASEGEGDRRENEKTIIDDSIGAVEGLSHRHANRLNDLCFALKDSLINIAWFIKYH